MTLLDSMSKNPIFIYTFYTLVFIILIIVLFYLYKNNIGTFHQANLYKRLRSIYKTSDYPYIKEIILPLNKEEEVYYDAIVFGDKNIYIIEMKNHEGNLYCDKLNDWYYLDSKKKRHTFINPVYELDIKKHVLNNFMKVNPERIKGIVVYNTQTKIVGNCEKKDVISIKQLRSYINHMEATSNLPKLAPNSIEKIGNYILSINIKKYKIRNKVINKLKNQRRKR